MKSILLYIDNDKGLKARIQAALDLARHSQAHITCLQPLNYEIFAPGDFYGSAMVAAIPEIKKAAEDLREEVEHQIRDEDVSWDWHTVSGMASVKLLEHSPLHDIILVGPHDLWREKDGPSFLVGELAIKSPIPVLVVPKNWNRLDLAAPIMVAWNGSAESCTALRQSVPLLSDASNVILANVSEEKDRQQFDFPSDEGARYLSRYGIACEILEISRGKAKIADTLFASASERGCGLIVMGAYGHSRFAEFLFGGVTRRALSDPEMPILLAH